MDSQDEFEDVYELDDMSEQEGDYEDDDVSELMENPEDMFVYGTKHLFFAHGLVEVSLAVPHDCPICRESMPAVNPLAHIVVDNVSLLSASEPESITIDTEISTAPGDGLATLSPTPPLDSQASTQPASVTPESYIIPHEYAVQIVACKHIFGRGCLETWFQTSGASSCPYCNKKLFPTQATAPNSPVFETVYFPPPTREDRLVFILAIEVAFGERQLANQMRRYLMSSWVREEMRMITVTAAAHRGVALEMLYTGDAAAYDEEGTDSEWNGDSISDDGSEYSVDSDTEEEPEEEEGHEAVYDDSDKESRETDHDVNNETEDEEMDH